MNCSIVMRVEQGSEKKSPKSPHKPGLGGGGSRAQYWEILHIFDDLACFKVMFKAVSAALGV